MKPISRLLATACVGLAFAFPTYAEDLSADTVLATVNGTDITLGHMIITREQLPAQYRQLPAEVLYDGIMEQLINQVVLSQNAGDTISKRSMLTLELDRRALQADEALKGIADGATTDEAIKAAYEARFKNAEKQPEYKARHILLESEDDAKAVIALLNEGGDFIELAKEKSTGPSGPSGGDLGWFQKGAMVDVFFDAVVTLEEGGISAPVKSQFGWHVIKLDEKRLADTPTLEEMRGELSNEIQSDAVQKAIEKLNESADITKIDKADLDVTKLFDTSLIGK
ncbi:MAG: peptidylprolyl isomerase [Halocynthiibacter sp.]